MKINLDYLSDPRIFAINREKAVSSHHFYTSLKNLTKNYKDDYLLSLNGVWSFAYYDHPNKVPESIYEKSFDLSSTDSISVPSHIQLNGYDKIHYTNTIYPWDGHENLTPPEIPQNSNPTGIYLKDIYIDSETALKNIFLQFDGVEVAFYLLINGEFVGYSEDSFTPARFNVSKYLVKGKNRITVQVQKYSTANWLEDQDFWRFSGIFRDVYLYSTPSVHLNDLYIYHDLFENYEKAKINVEMKFIGKTQKKFFKIELYRENKLVYTSESVPIKDSKETFSFNLDNIELWSDEDPNLYESRIIILDHDDSVIEVSQQMIGLREFKIIDKIMHLNGKRVVFKGVNRHEFNYQTGRVISEEDMLWDIKFLKMHNFNSVRTSHYPNHRRWYELCDEFGIMIIDEANLESHGTWQKYNGVDGTNHVPGNLDEWHGTILDRGISMFERDKNHPSIVIWSCGNESFAGTNILEMANYFRKKDPRRVVQYEGVFWNRQYNQISDVESRMYAKVSDIIEYLENNPNKPFINCEYSHAMGNSCGNIGDYSDLEDKYPLYQGGFIWDYIDQGIEKKLPEKHIAYGGDFDDRPTDYNFCINGIINADRTISPKVQEIKHVFSPIKLEIDGKTIKIKNNFNFTNLNRFLIRFTSSNSYEILSESTKVIELAPQESIEFTYNWPEHKSEYVINSVDIITENIYTFKNIENIIAHEQEIILRETDTVQKNTFKLIQGDGNLSVENDKIKAMFHKQKGLVSLRINNEEILNTSIPKPQFVRATTDNDRGNHLEELTAYWYAANFYTRVIDFDVKSSNSGHSISFDYLLLGEDAPKLKITFTFGNDGMIVNYDYSNGFEGIIPMHAICIQLKKEFNEITYLGKGPEENYIDRNRGAKIMRHTISVDENVSSYLIPQEYGNRTEVYELIIKNPHSHNSIKIKAIETPFEFKALPNSWLELESANHQFELSEHQTTYLTIAGKQMGVGGDDSWGAPVLDKYLIKSDEDFSFSFKVEVNE